MTDNNPDALVPDSDVARNDFNVHPRSLKRWEEDPRTKFAEICPRYEVNKRGYRRRGDIENFKRHCVRRAVPSEAA